jgi:hypothetical protein
MRTVPSSHQTALISLTLPSILIFIVSRSREGAQSN